MKQISLGSLCFLLFLVAALGQNTKSLHVGDLVPEIRIKNIVNYEKETILLTENKDKLLILDFWTTNCIPCINSFPKLDSLQNAFGDKVEILSVTNEPKNKATDLLNRLKVIKKISRPSVVDDTILGKIFPYNSVPHVVWIKDNKVLAITSNEEITSYNIQSILSGENIRMKEKKDFENGDFQVYIREGRLVFPPSTYKIEANETKLLEIPGDKVGLYSVLTKSISNFTQNSTFSSKWFVGKNLDPTLLYTIAMFTGSPRLFNVKSIICEISDTLLRRNIGSSYRTISDSDTLKYLLKNHTYCYEIYVPEALAQEKYDLMLNELNKYFGYIYGIEGVKEKRLQKYLAVVRTSTEDKLKSKGGAVGLATNAFWLKVQNGRMVSFINSLVLPLQMLPPVVDETGYKGNIDIEINCELKDLNALNSELAKYDLKIEEKEKVMDFGIIRQKKK